VTCLICMRATELAADLPDIYIGKVPDLCTECSQDLCAKDVKPESAELVAWAVQRTKSWLSKLYQRADRFTSGEPNPEVRPPYIQPRRRK